MVLPVRHLYMPGHFGNSYEVMGEFEMEEKLKEAAYWGFNGYLDWFDSAGIIAPFNETDCHFSNLVWKKKLTFYKIAQKLKMDIGFCITPNHVFADQITAGNCAKKGDRMFGQLVCPSKASGEKEILKFYEWVFKTMADEGIKVKDLQFAPYDYGGCSCEKCKPWILTFAKLSLKIYKIAKKYHQNAELHFIGWWWKPEEHKLFNDWANKTIPGLIKSISLHILYNTFEPINVTLPKGCKRRAFIHAGYCNNREILGIQDVYGLMGPVVAPERIENTIKGLVRANSEGYMVYSEGMYEDVNHALIGSLSSGKAGTAKEVLVEYAKRYFKVNENNEKRWADWFSLFGDWSKINIGKAKKEFSSLSSLSSPGWRLEQWAQKIKLVDLHLKLNKMKGWSTTKEKLIRQWRYELEISRRNIHGLTTQRHAFEEKYCGAKWHKEWLDRQNKKSGVLSKEA